MRKKEKMRKEVYLAYDSMNKFQRWCVHNGFYNFYRVRNGICEWLINDKQNNKDIIKILEKEHERIN